ncbi:MAG: Response regulator protein TodT [Deltaproteobacteria bacterium ADurb.BinA179]|jgi:DNA-binding NtrC family response regulator|nr:response regulator [Deltaproteobacteria bacterium]MDI9543318.1 response regulator [Pseudomonadota bacterium]OPZ30002.1 MAG: Response regulator protein TodT [Deltaproteobacteria bacterium ADurb.BinA179]HOD70137.1 response regulator [Deltaproteobacteria bacterium]HOE72357.1 response regulator [Deltaproteobacteria bacterium]
MDHVRAAIIDDDDEILDLIEQILKEEDIQTRRYARAEKFLADLKRHDFDLIITDLMLPGISGLDLLDDLNSRGIDTPVVIITGYASIDSAIEAVNRGAFYYIKKPFNIEEIRCAINRFRQRRDTMEMVKALQKQIQMLQERIEEISREKLQDIPDLNNLQGNLEAGKAFAAIEYLGKLKSDGLISDKEFGAYKGKLLKRII